MAAVESQMLALGTKAPDFTLPAPNLAREVSFQEVRGSTATVVMFICNHCPFVIHVIAEVVAIAREYQQKSQGKIRFVAINSNDVAAYPADSPQKMVPFAQQYGIDFAYCYDETQAVAKAYHAACTPDFYVFDANDALAYRGRMDGARPKNTVPVNGIDLRKALDALVVGQRVSTQQPSIGCNIKWK